MPRSPLLRLSSLSRTQPLRGGFLFLPHQTQESQKIQPQINANERKCIQDKVNKDDPTSRRVLGCAFEIGKVLGLGSLKSVYDKALCIELAERGPQPSIFRLICVYLRSSAAKKYRVSTRVGIAHPLTPWPAKPLFPGSSASFQKNRTQKK